MLRARLRRLPFVLVSPALLALACGPTGTVGAGTGDDAGTATGEGNHADLDSGAVGTDALDPVRDADPFAGVPRTFISDAPPADTFAETFTLHLSASIAYCTFDCSLDGVPLADCPIQLTLPPVGEGPHVFKAVAISPRGVRDPEGAEADFNVDRTLPDTTIVTGPPALTAEPTATVTFEGTEPGFFQCALDTAGPTPCASPFTTRALSEGPHLLAITLRDPAGNVDPTPATVEWRIDQTPPDTQLLTQPEALLRADVATFTFSSNDVDVVAYACSLDAAPFSACTSPAAVGPLTAGPHHFAVRAVDALGLADPSPAGADFTVELSSPETTVDTAPPARTQDDAAHFTFGPADAQFVCTVDEAAEQPCAAQFDLADLTEGPHTLTVAALYPPDRHDPTPETVSWVVDRTPPVVTLVAPPPLFTRTGAFTVDFDVVDGPDGAPAEALCTLDGGPAERRAPGPNDFAVALEGPHTLTICGVDLVGLGSAECLDVAFTYDATPPHTVVTQHPPPESPDTHADLRFHAEPDGTVACTFDGAPVPCDGALSLSDLSEGEHIATFAASDAAGNVESPAVEVRWRIDVTAPDTRLLASPALVSNAANPGFTFDSDPPGEPGVTFQCRVDAAPWVACTSPLVLPGLQEGGHHLAVQASDPFGNADPTPAEYAWEIDTTPPEAQILAGPAEIVAVSSVDFEFGPPGATLTCQLDAAPPEPCFSTLHLDGLGEGGHTLRLTATDAAGNTSPVPAVWVFAVDTVAPVVEIVSGPGPYTGATEATFEFTAPEPVLTICTIDRGPPVPCQTGIRYAGLTEGPHVFAVLGVDAAGNHPDAPTTYPFAVDLTPPAQPSPPAAFPGDASVMLLWPVLDPDAAGYVVLKSTGDQPAPMPIGQVRVDPNAGLNMQLAFVDRHIANGTGAGYVLIAVDAAGHTSPPSLVTPAVASNLGRFEPPRDALPPVSAVAPLADGRLLLVASDGSGTSVWDPATGLGAPTSGAAPGPWGSGAAVLADGRVLLAGGENDGIPLDTAYRFDPADGTFTDLSPLPDGGRARPVVLPAFDGSAVVAGGALPGVARLEGDVWSSPGPMADVLGSTPLAVARPDGSILVFGPGPGPRSVDPIAGALTDLAMRPDAQDWSGAAGYLRVDGAAVLVGPALSAAAYRSETDTWSDAPAASVPRFNASTVALPDGSTLLLGGDGPAGPASLVESAHAGTGVFDSVGVAPTPPGTAPPAVLLDDGRVLMGGDAPGFFRPWFVDAGPRPVVDAAPAAIRPGVNFEVVISGVLPPERFTLLRRTAAGASPTVAVAAAELTAVAGAAGRYTLRLDDQPAVPAPGPCLLFALDERGVPSVGRPLNLGAVRP